MVNFLVPLKRKDYKSTMLQKILKCEVKGRNEVLQVETLVRFGNSGIDLPLNQRGA